MIDGKLQPNRQTGGKLRGSGDLVIWLVLGGQIEPLIGFGVSLRNFNLDTFQGNAPKLYLDFGHKSPVSRTTLGPQAGVPENRSQGFGTRDRTVPFTSSSFPAKLIELTPGASGMRGPDQ